MSQDKNIQINRRRVLALGLAGAGALGLAASEAATGKKTGAPLALTAQTTEGPYYFDPKLVRADIAEGLHGVPLEIRLSVLDQAGLPLQGARVDVWHCNAAGVYSGYAGQGERGGIDTRGKTFLRGSLITDTQGVAAFRSVYPGWYEGRTTHIHFKVLNVAGSRTMLTSQFFLPDALSEFLYTQLPDYRRGKLRQTLNSNDGIALSAGNSVAGAVREEQGRYVATLAVVVDRNANQAIDRPWPPAPPGGMGEGPPPGMPGDIAGRPPGMGGPQAHGFADEAARTAALVPGAAKK
ncbi:MAG: intradiol ring-cleavage dioxygenase [Pseudomonadota bacterium]